MQIDLTNDDDDEEAEEVNQRASHRIRPSSPACHTRPSASSGRNHGRTDLERNQTGALLINDADDERLRLVRPVLVISPLPATIVNAATTSGSSTLRTGVGSTEISKSVEKPLTDESHTDSARTASNVPVAKSGSYRHLFDAIGRLSPNIQHTTGKTNASVRRESDLQPDRTSEGPGRSGKRRHTSDKRDGADPPWRSIRPVSSYLQSSERMDDCVPGVDLFDYSDGEC
ncbi:unnamed protein product [Echinostoma caproni]|uniref:Uncharacterized protein n=1 Tax=Echinostoma caproni TaxID=27848 RepID=A0A183AE91_9TREM|nr:unnamed protein product [Echinostoma caproni]